MTDCNSNFGPMEKADGGSHKARLQILRVDSDDLETRLFEFRHRIYVQEMGINFGEVVQAKYLMDDCDDVSTNYAVLEGPDVVGSFRTTDLRHLPAHHPIFERYITDALPVRISADQVTLCSRLAFDPRARSMGLMYRVVSLGMTDAIRRNIRLAIGDTSREFLSLYRRIGVYPYGSDFVDPTGRQKIRIYGRLDEFRYVDQDKSPLLRTISRKFSSLTPAIGGDENG